ncbi:MAG: hypothetical protein J1F35_08850 [Erysipelotrichales bacterium]|nr:hypothetical protein [Erysipelotrichales bacterium]
MNKRVGYLVSYATGYYDDYKEHFVAVYDNKEDAEKRCKEIDKQNREPVKCKISDDDWEKIMFEYDDWFEKDKYEGSEIQKKYPNLKGRECYDYEGWEIDHNQSIKEQEMLYEDIVIKYYPNMNREEARHEIEQRDLKTMMEYREYHDAWVDEIDLFLNK